MLLRQNNLLHMVSLFWAIIGGYRVEPNEIGRMDTRMGSTQSCARKDLPSKGARITSKSGVNSALHRQYVTLMRPKYIHIVRHCMSMYEHICSSNPKHNSSLSNRSRLNLEMPRGSRNKIEILVLCRYFVLAVNKYWYTIEAKQPL